tara:strand:- start:227 stop:2164 length:1938 start_codon:yes stop_codon:yes gene_type:complete
MANNVTNVNFQNPAYDYAGDMSEIERRKELAKALQAQAMAPGGGTKMAGNIAIRNSPLEGVAKIAQALSSQYIAQGAQDKQTELAKRSQTDMQNTLAKAMQVYKGTPATTRAPDPFEFDQMGEGTPEPTASTRPAVAGDPMQAGTMLMQNPQTAQMGMSMMTDAMKSQQLAQALAGAGVGGMADMTADQAMKLIASGNPTAKILGEAALKRIEFGGVSGNTAATVAGARERTAAQLAQAKEFHDGLSAYQKAQLANEAARIGISVQDLILRQLRAQTDVARSNFDTGSNLQAPGVTPPQVPQVPGMQQGANPQPFVGGAQPFPLPQSQQGAPTPLQGPQGAPMNGQLPLVPGMSPNVRMQPNLGRIPPNVQANAGNDQLAILNAELASQQAAGRVDPSLVAEINNLQGGQRANAGVQPSPQQLRDEESNRIAMASSRSQRGAPANTGNGASAVTVPTPKTLQAEELARRMGKIDAVSNKPLTEGQAKAVHFATRMEASEKIISDLAKEGTTSGVPGAQSTGMLGSIINTTLTGNQQKLVQAKRDFINAVLRRESGAVISKDEFKNAEKQYFPQVGDSDGVIAQKEANRRIAINGIKADIPANHRDRIMQEVSGGKPAGAPAVGTVVDGYRFKGGNPANRASWERQ